MRTRPGPGRLGGCCGDGPAAPTGQNARMTDQRLVIRRGRHVGWWIKGRVGRGFKTFDWWPTKRLALMVARFWVRAAKRAGAGEVTIEVRETAD
jgi:hypothetical protein